MRDLEAENDELRMMVLELTKRVEALEERKKKRSPVRALKLMDEMNVELIPEQPVRISRTLMESWAQTYPQEFLQEEWKKCRNWVLANPHKAPKSAWAKFFNSWFQRSWDSYRKTLKSNPPASTVEDLEEILRGKRG